ncbi:hypothetical protein ABT237_41980 [Streptomyces sp. NPDC001581]
METDGGAAAADAVLDQPIRWREGRQAGRLHGCERLGLPDVSLAAGNLQA